MASKARIAANRQNARRSTGPRSATGKQRVARNAFKHGLAIPVALNPTAHAAAERLARLIAGPDADPERSDIARRVAEAEIDLIRIRQARATLLRGPIRDQYRYSITGARIRLRVLQNEYDRTGNPSLSEEMLELVDPIPLSEISSAERAAIRIDEIARLLARLDRYEARATSRRKAAISAFDALGLEATSAPPGLGRSVE